ncbi:MAG: RNA-protein complex protein Nop10 [Candidatus Thermoplasmatota archaeon]|nr:RNA-protein complex protein Nop10 [Candidatus Thermoplasmatota archaeon]MCL5730726.1 RNA-protein complex protein Nop10 [Candidatus Thermoplasmatota archaeon]
MKTTIRKCNDCGSYTLSTTCPKCGKATVMAIPPKFAPGDRFVRYRLEEEMKKYGKNPDKAV